MPLNPSLIPTAVVDKNGRQTTVHKKPTTAANTARIPAPALSPSEGLTERTVKMRRKKLAAQLTMDIRDLFFQADSRWDEEHYSEYRAIKPTLEGYSLDALTTVALALNSGNDEIAFGVATEVSQSAEERTIGESLHFHTRNPTLGYYNAAALAKGLHHYEQLPLPEDLTEADEEWQAKCDALLRVTAAVQRAQPAPVYDPYARIPIPARKFDRDLDTRGSYCHRTVTSLADDDLIHLVLEHADRADEMAELILEHMVADASSLRGLMDGITPSLATGAL